MLKTFSALIAATAFILSPVGAAAAQSFRHGAIEIIDPHARFTTPAQRSDAGFMTIVNHGDSADYLTAISGDFADMQVHLSKMESNGVMTMAPVARLEIPAHGKVVLKHGGYHVMMMGLKHVLKIGDEMPATLTFAKAGKIAIQFRIGKGAIPGMHGSELSH